MGVCASCRDVGSLVSGVGGDTTHVLSTQSRIKELCLIS